MSATASVHSAPAAIPDWQGLRRCWHPVAFADTLGSEPQRITVLGEALALWRDSGGTPHALADLCIHRGTALSLGRVIVDQLACPYHGWRYGTDGVCNAIPQLADPTRVPGKARVAAYRCQTRYGLLWVALEEPRWALPEVPELESSEKWQIVPCGPYPWTADASRQVENLTDFGHFPWVHPGLLGDPERAVVPKHTVETNGHVLRYEIVRPEAASSEEFPVFANEQATCSRASQPLRAAPPIHDRAAARVGWRARHGLLLRLPAGQ